VKLVSKTGIQTSISAEEGGLVPRHAIYGRELSSNEYFAGRFDGYGNHRAVRADAWIKGAVQTSVGIKAGDIRALCSIERRKSAANDDLAVGFDSHTTNSAAATWSRTWIKCDVE